MTLVLAASIAMEPRGPEAVRAQARNEVGATAAGSMEGYEVSVHAARALGAVLRWVLNVSSLHRKIGR